MGLSNWWVFREPLGGPGQWGDGPVPAVAIGGAYDPAGGVISWKKYHPPSAASETSIHVVGFPTSCSFIDIDQRSNDSLTEFGSV